MNKVVHQMRSAAHCRSSQPRPAPRAGRGFTLIEILVTVLIIGIITIFVIPNFLDSLQKSKQRRTMADIHAIGRAQMSWLTDQMGGAAAGGLTVDVGDYGQKKDPGELRDELVPGYLADLPQDDGWGHEIDYFLNTDDLLAPRVILIRSRGRDDSFSGDSYAHASFVTTDYDQDIVWADGIFIRWPVGVSTADP